VAGIASLMPRSCEIRLFSSWNAICTRCGTAMKNSFAAQLRARVKRFAIRILKFVRTLSRDPATAEVAGQLARCGPSVSANYHAACRGRSRAEFIAKLGLVLEEADETEHWLDVLKDGGLASGAELTWLRGEAAELRAIFFASVDTARTNYYRDNH
jgi:four helix bundle protein